MAAVCDLCSLGHGALWSMWQDRYKLLNFLQHNCRFHKPTSKVRMLRLDNTEAEMVASLARKEIYIVRLT